MSLYGAAAPAPAYEMFRDEICEISFVPSRRKGSGKDRSDGKTRKKT